MKNPIPKSLLKKVMAIHKDNSTQNSTDISKYLNYTSIEDIENFDTLEEIENILKEDTKQAYKKAQIITKEELDKLLKAHNSNPWDICQKIKTPNDIKDVYNLTLGEVQEKLRFDSITAYHLDEGENL